MAPAHIGQGSIVEYTVAPTRIASPCSRDARRMASNSACQVTSRSVFCRFWPVASTTPSRTRTEPTGQSPRAKGVLRVAERLVHIIGIGHGRDCTRGWEKRGWTARSDALSLTPAVVVATMPPMPSWTLTRRKLLLAGGAALSSSMVKPGVARAQGRRGEIIAGLSERMLTLDPANHYSISATSMLRHVYDPLLDVTHADRFVPALAESWRPLSNTTWRFTLRKGVSFHDGSPFTADSVVFTLKRVRGQRQADQVVGLSGHRRRPEGRRLRGHGDDEAALRLPARTHDDARHAAAECGRGRGSVLSEAGGYGTLPVRELDPWRSRRARGQRQILEAGCPARGESHGPLHPRALDARGRPAGRRDPRDRSCVARHGPDAQGHSWGQGPRYAGTRGAALAFPARPGDGEGPACAQGRLSGHQPRRHHQGPAAGLRAAGREPDPARAHRTHEPRSEAVRPGQGAPAPQGSRAVESDARLRSHEGPLSQAAGDRPGRGGDAGRSRGQGEHPEPGNRHGSGAAHGGELRPLLLGLGPHAPRPRLVLRSVVHEGRRREAHALLRPAGRVAHRRGPRARSQGAPAELRGDRADLVG